MTNGNNAVGLGVMASGMELVSMYPITPATSASHYLADVYHEVGGFLHQAEDEIAAIGFAIGASYAGKTACTITSGPGLALKTEILGLAVMAEMPLVIAMVQRGGPSTGLPTKVEQGDLLASLFGEPGDAPKVVMAAATIEECFHFVITARRLAEAFRTPVMLLTDANLATGVQPFARPEPTAEWLAPPIDQSAWNEEIPPYNWDAETGLSPRPIPAARRRVRADRSGPHRAEPGRLRLRLQPERLRDAQPQAGRAGQHAEAARGPRRSRRRPARRRLGLDARRDRRGRRPGAGGGPPGVVGAHSFPVAARAGAQEDLLGVSARS